MSRAPVVFASSRVAAGRELPTLRVVSPPLSNRLPLRAEKDEPEADYQKLVLTDELTSEMVRESSRLESAEPRDILRWASERFAPRFTMATAFGPEAWS